MEENRLTRLGLGVIHSLIYRLRPSFCKLTKIYVRLQAMQRNATELFFQVPTLHM